MGVQSFKDKPAASVTKNDDLEQEFEALKSKPVEKADEWTIINRRLITGCGCGGSSTNIHLAFKGNNPKIGRGTDDTLDLDDVARLQRKYPDLEVRRGHITAGVTDSYNPRQHREI